jgi:hypothetical protein
MVVDAFSKKVLFSVLEKKEVLGYKITGASVIGLHFGRNLTLLKALRRSPTSAPRSQTRRPYTCSCQPPRM